MDTSFRADSLAFIAIKLETLRISMLVGTFSDEIRTIEKAREAFQNNRSALEACGLTLSLQALDRLDEKLKSGGIDKKLLASESGAVLQRLLDEMPTKRFFVTSRHLSRTASDPFGVEVSKAFPESAADISEAQLCIWNERGTAAVFHLMRVVERYVKFLGRKLKVSIDTETSNWAQITAQVDKAVRSLPLSTKRQREKRDRLAATIAHLNAVRIAWRNPVMHPKSHYNIEEAQQIFDQVKILMRSLTIVQK